MHAYAYGHVRIHDLMIFIFIIFIIFLVGCLFCLIEWRTWTWIPLVRRNKTPKHICRGDIDTIQQPVTYIYLFRMIDGNLDHRQLFVTFMACETDGHDINVKGQSIGMVYAEYATRRISCVLLYRCIVFAITFDREVTLHDSANKITSLHFTSVSHHRPITRSFEYTVHVGKKVKKKKQKKKKKKTKTYDMLENNSMKNKKKHNFICPFSKVDCDVRKDDGAVVRNTYDIRTYLDICIIHINTIHTLFVLSRRR